ncbi:hypothetical protein JHK85_040777 [Glycine max]|nr:hypothetical protein JHK87_040002 [Glycine soja]KAG4965802.1 hypothetical protein JHK85_040777 [Glycine max]
MKATSDYGALTTSVANFQWSQNFKELASVWGLKAVQPTKHALGAKVGEGKVPSSCSLKQCNFNEVYITSLVP